MAHILLLFLIEIFRITQEIVDFFRGSGPRYNCRNFVCGIAHAKMWTPSLRFLNNWGKTFLGLGRPGVAVARILGLAQNWLGGITRGPREVQNKIGSELLTQSILAQ